MEGCADSRHNKQRGFTLLELIVVVVIVSILFLVALDKYLDLLVDVERATMAQTLGSLRSALAMQVAQKIVDGEVESIAAMTAANPMDFLSELPDNYLGALEPADLAAVAAGSWYFDRARDLLVYRVKNSAYFAGGAGTQAQAHFKIELVFADNNGNGRYESVFDRIEGARLAAQEPYAWLKQRQERRSTVSP